MEGLKTIAHIYNAYSGKFGIPRQSGLADLVTSRIVFEPRYRDPSAFHGLEEFSHLWLIWEFSLARREKWSATVRPPILGGNERMGVFATRSPFRPNPLGLSCVRLEGIEYTEHEGPVLMVGGADLASGTPIYDVKPYLPYADCHPEASGGFTDRTVWPVLEVRFDRKAEHCLNGQETSQLIQILSLDPRPRYQEDPERIYGMAFGEKNVRFRVEDGILTVLEIQ